MRLYHDSAQYILASILLIPLTVGWGKDYRNEDFVAQGGVKHQLVNLISSVQTLLRGEAKSCPNSLCKQRVIVFSIHSGPSWFAVGSETPH